VEAQFSRAASPYWWKKKGRRDNSLEQVHRTGGKRRGEGTILWSSFIVLVVKEGVEGQFSRVTSLYWWYKKGLRGNSLEQPHCTGGKRRG
jgi:hypothetical protein